MRGCDDLATWVTTVVQSFCQSAENTLQDQASDRAWADPLVGFSRGDDPLYGQYKEVVGPFHWTPWEIFTQTFPATRVEPEELTVICWILPQTEATKADASMAKHSTTSCENTSRTPCKGQGTRPLPRCFLRNGSRKGPIATSLPRPGPSGMPPTPRAWGPLASAMG